MSLNNHATCKEMSHSTKSRSDLYTGTNEDQSTDILKRGAVVSDVDMFQNEGLAHFLHAWCKADDNLDPTCAELISDNAMHSTGWMYGNAADRNCGHTLPVAQTASHRPAS